MHGWVRQVVVGLSALAMVGVNGWTSVSGPGVREVSDRYFNALTPANYAFAIWGPIFLGALALSLYQALPAQRNSRRLDTLGWPLTVSYLATALWPLAFLDGQLGLSLLLMVLMLLGLATCYVRATDAAALPGQPRPPAFDWLVRLPTALFFGWITAATFVNTALWLLRRGVSELGGLSNELWAAALLLVAAGVGAFIVRRSKEVAYGLVLIWAAWGIVAAHPGAGVTQMAAIVLTAAILAVSVWSLMTPRVEAERRPA